jgi:hypothetical protein
VRRRRHTDRPFYARAVNAGAAVASEFVAKAVRRPVDSAAIAAAAAASLIIIVNAVFLQAGARSTPFLATANPEAAIYVPRPVDLGPVRPAVVASAPVPQPVAVRRNDPIAELIGPSPRIAAVQRALSDYGYGQIRPSGMLDDATSSAIEKFEREHKWPVTGRVSDRLVAGLAALVGHPL